MKGVWGTMFLRQGFGGLEPSAPCGTEAERAQWAKKRGGASGTARSTACGATMQAPRVETARRNVWKRKGALARLFRFPDEAPNVPHREAI